MQMALWHTLQLLILLVLSHSAIAAPLGENFSQANADAYVEAALRTLGDAEASVSDKDYAVQLLGALDKASVAIGYKSSACATVSSALLSKDLERIHHGISLRNGVGCTGPIPASVSGAIQAAMEKEDLWSLYHGTLSAPSVGLAVNAGQILDKIVGLVDTSGSVRSHPSGATTNNNVFMAAVLLSKLAPSLPENGKAYAMAQEAVDTIKENNLDSQPSVVVPLNVAKGDDNVTIRPLKLRNMARDLLEASRTSRPESMLRVYQAIKAVASYSKAPLPIKLAPPSPSVEELSSGQVRVQVTTLLGYPANVQTVSLSQLTRADGSDVLGTAEGTSLTSADSAGFRTLPAVEVAAGLYTAEFTVEMVGGEKGKSLKTKLPIAVTSTAVLVESRVTVSESRSPSDPASATHVIALGENLPADVQASVLDGHHVHVAFTLKGGAAIAPHQAFVRFTHALTGLETFFVATPDLSGDGRGVGRFSVSVALGEETSTFLQRSGAYIIAVVVGGPLVTTPILEPLGAIDLDFPAIKTREWPLYSRALLHESDVTLEALPEKHHTFREPEPRPPVGVSLFFTVVVLVTLLGLASALRRGGADLRRLPKDGYGKAWCGVYQLCMVSFAILFVLYWVALTMAHTLQVLAVLALVTVCTGRKALQALAMEEDRVRQRSQMKLD